MVGGLFMKKHLFLIAMATLAVSCQMNELEKATENKSAKSIRIGAVAEQTSEQTKTSLASDNKVLWSAGDQLTVFGSANLASSAIFTLAEGEEGKPSAIFEGEDLEGDNILAIYPASYVKPDSKITAVEGGYSVPVTIPQIQNYATNSFSDKNFLAVGIGTRSALKFKNVMGLLEISIWSAVNRSVSQLEIISQDNLAGNAEVIFSENGTPELKWISDTTKTLYLKFDHSVVVSQDESNPTKFYVIAPAGAFSSGFAFNFRSGSSLFHMKNTDSDNVIVRSTVREMPVYRSAFSFQTATTLYKPTSITDYSMKQTVYDSISTEYYYHFCVPKANFIDEAEGIDSVALFNFLKDTVTNQAKAKMETDPTTYPDFKTAAQSVMRNKNLTFTKNLYNSCSFLSGIVSFDATEHGLTALTNIRASQGKTLDHIMYDEDGVNFDSGNAGAIEARQTFTISSNKVYTPANYASYTLSKAAGFEGTALSVKHKAMSLSSFKSNVSSDLTSGCTDAVIEYFKSNGSTISESSLTKFNDGTAVSSGLLGASEGGSYVIMMQVETAEGTSVYLKTMRIANTARMWMVPTIAADTKSFTIKTQCKLASCKYCNLTSSNTKTMAEISSTLDEKGTELSAAQIEKLNKNGSITFGATEIAAGKGRYIMIRATNMAGDVFDYAAFAYVPAS